MNGTTVPLCLGPACVKRIKPGSRTKEMDHIYIYHYKFEVV